VRGAPRVVVALAAAAALGGCGDAPAPTAAPDRDPTGLRPWVIERADAVRPAAPSADGAGAELEAVVAAQRARTAAVDSAIRRWDGLPGEPWTRVALDELQFRWYLLPDIRDATPARSARAMALLHVAIADALLATWDAKGAHPRAAPAARDARVRALVALRAGESSYPSEHAAAASAAAPVLAYLFPTADTAGFHRLAAEAAASRVAAGAAAPSDVAAGAAIGRAVAARVLALARADGADAARAPWVAPRPDGALAWRPTPPRLVQVPFDADAGAWRPWVLASGDAFRPPPPPAPGSPAFAADLEELRRLGDGARTVQQADVARRWATDAPSAAWEDFLSAELRARRPGPLQAARARALVSVAMHDAFVACWDAKYHYNLARPVTADPRLRTVFTTPPFPSYPSGHSTISGAAAEVFAVLFPDSAAAYRARADSASLSRVWGGVHYRFDVVAGHALGEHVGRAVLARAGDRSAR
jgi:membrane-associated phospholipid phosphatase